MQSSLVDATVKQQRPLRVVNCSELPADWCWLSQGFPEQSQEWLHCAAQPGLLDPVRGRPYIARWRAAWAAVGAARREPAVIVTHLPRFAYLCSEISQMRGVRAPILAFAFNFTDLPQGSRRRRMTRAFQRVDRFTVFSRHERKLYCDYFGLDPDRVDFIHWGTYLPAPRTEPAIEQGDYICAIGGNARDYATLVEAVRRLPHIRLVMIARPHNLVGLNLPPNVTAHANVPWEFVENVVWHSRFMVLPLSDAQIASGHVTVVAAMHAGKAVVATNSPGILDYVRQEQTGLLTPLHDAAAMAEAVTRLWEDVARCSRLGAAGREFAAAHCTEAAAIGYFRQYLQSKGLWR